LLRSLISLGSRLSVVSVLLTSVVVGMESCQNQEECLFEDGCGEGGGGGEPGGSGVFCGGKECPASKCLTNIRCGEDGIVCAGDAIDGWQDLNACTIDTCDPLTGIVTHDELSAEDIDDGDECTMDYCDPAGGAMHQDICGGA
jgi:hypothetical protein